MLEVITAALVLVLDQVSKVISAEWLTTLSNNSFELIPGVFHLAYVENRGAAFGMLQDARWFFIVLTFIVVVLMVWFLIKERSIMHKLMRVTLALILAGALGNLIDRVVLGYVRDMFYFALIDFAVFNVADAALTVGMFILILDLLFGKGRHVYDTLEKRSKDKKDATKKVQNTDPEDDR